MSLRNIEKSLNGFKERFYDQLSRSVKPKQTMECYEPSFLSSNILIGKVVWTRFFRLWNE